MKQISDLQVVHERFIRRLSKKKRAGKSGTGDRTIAGVSAFCFARAAKLSRPTICPELIEQSFKRKRKIRLQQTVPDKTKIGTIGDAESGLC
jgi:hypothetical protein